MALLFNKQILRFVYQLTRETIPHESYRKLWTEANRKAGLNVTERTLHNWWRRLQKPFYYRGRKYYDRHVVYFPIFSKELLGLKTFYVLVEPEKPKPVLEILGPLLAYSMWAFANNKAQLMLYCHVPGNAPSDLHDILQEMLVHGLINGFKFFEVGTPWMLYAPFHKVVTRDGAFDFLRNDRTDISRQVSKCLTYIKNFPACEMIEEVRKNPLILAVLMEQYGAPIERGFSPEKLKQALRKRFIKRARTSPNAKAWLTLLKPTPLEKACRFARTAFVSQMAVSYLPLEVGQSFFVFLVLDRYPDLRATLTLVGMHSLSVRVYPPERDKIFVVCLTNAEALQHLLFHLGSTKIHLAALALYESSLSLLRKYFRFDYLKLFDVKERAWTFDKGEFFDRIRRAAV